MREIDTGWVDRVCDDVLSRFPDTISKLGDGVVGGVEADSGLGVEGHGGLREGFGGLREGFL